MITFLLIHREYCSLHHVVVDSKQFAYNLNLGLILLEVEQHM